MFFRQPSHGTHRLRPPCPGTDSVTSWVHRTLFAVDLAVDLAIGNTVCPDACSATRLVIRMAISKRTRCSACACASGSTQNETESAAHCVPFIEFESPELVPFGWVPDSRSGGGS
jgi:hypothetical protein